MKKLLLCFTVAMILTALIACGTPSETTASAQKTSTAPQSTVETPPSSSTATQTAVPHSTALQTATPESTEAQDPTPVSTRIETDYITFPFESIDDMETYIQTGSRDKNDYSHELPYSFDLFPSHTLMQEYLSPIVLFDLPVSLFSTQRFGFQQQSEDLTKLRYYFSLDDLFIELTETDQKSIEAYMRSKNIAFTFTPYAEIDTVTYGHVIRQCGETAVVCQIENGVPTKVRFLLSRYAFQISILANATDETAKDAFDRFMNDRRTRDIAGLFSEHDEVFEAAVTRLTDMVKTKHKPIVSIEIKPLGNPIVYTFDAISDMETYIRTSSQDPADYTDRISQSLGDLPSTEFMKEYLSPITLFDLDIGLFGESSSYIRHLADDFSKLFYAFDLDNVDIILMQTDADSVEAYLFLSYAAVRFTPYAEAATVSNGYVLRKAGDASVVYRVNDGIKRSAYLLIGNHVLSVSFVPTLSETPEEDFRSFMTDEKTKTLAALFSDSDEVFEAAVTELYEKAARQ